MSLVWSNLHKNHPGSFLQILVFRVISRRRRICQKVPCSLSEIMASEEGNEFAHIYQKWSNGYIWLNMSKMIICDCLALRPCATIYFVSNHEGGNLAEFLAEGSRCHKSQQRGRKMGAVCCFPVFSFFCCLLFSRLYPRDFPILHDSQILVAMYT